MSLGRKRNGSKNDISKMESLESKVLKILEKGRPVSRERLIRDVWGGQVVHPNTVSALIYRIKKNLPEGQTILTIQDGRSVDSVMWLYRKLV